MQISGHVQSEIASTLHFTLYVSKNREKVYVVCVEKSRKGVTFFGVGNGLKRKQSASK